MFFLATKKHYCIVSHNYIPELYPSIFSWNVAIFTAVTVLVKRTTSFKPKYYSDRNTRPKNWIQKTAANTVSQGVRVRYFYWDFFSPSRGFFFLAKLSQTGVPRKQASKPASKQASKAGSQRASKEGSQRASKPASQQASQPGSQPGNQQASQQASKQGSQRASKQASKAASKQASEQASKQDRKSVV